MYAIILLLAASTPRAEDLALALKAQKDFETVATAGAPRLSDALACVQSQAALLPVAPPQHVSLIHYRKGYCMLLAGIIRRDAATERAAAAEFNQALRTWLAAGHGGTPPAFGALAAIAALKAGPEIGELPALEAELAQSTDVSGCSPAAIPVSECRPALEAGRFWRGWIAERQGRLSDAAHLFEEFPNSGWPEWVAGRQAMDARRYAEAATDLERATQTWAMEEKATSGLAAMLRPAPEIRAALERLGEVQFVSGQHAAASATLDACLQREPRNAWAMFLRARAKHELGRESEAEADYERAARIALAGADARFSAGDAHFYRGVSLFQRHDYEGAEEEFATALSSEPAPQMKADAMAWWRMTAVAGGGCQASTGLLKASLAEASDFFPKDAARELVRGCRARAYNAAK